MILRGLVEGLAVFVIGTVLIAAFIPKPFVVPVFLSFYLIQLSFVIGYPWYKEIRRRQTQNAEPIAA